MMSRTNQRGVAMTVAIMIIVCSSILAGYALQAGWNQRRMAIMSGSKRDRIYYAARAGVVEARWRIRTNYTAGLTGVGAVDFNNAAFDADPYNLDITGDAVPDVQIDIGTVDGRGLRDIRSRGLDN